jgi:hypothetical protein
VIEKIIETVLKPAQEVADAVKDVVRPDKVKLSSGAATS